DGTRQERRVAGAFHADLPQHLRDNNLDVLVVDFHTLAAVHVLDLTGEVFLHFLFTRDAEDIVRNQWAIDQGLARLDLRARVDAQMLAVGNEVLALDAAFTADDDRPLAAAF